MLAASQSEEFSRRTGVFQHRIAHRLPRLEQSRWGVFPLPFTGRSAAEYHLAFSELDLVLQPTE